MHPTYLSGIERGTRNPTLEKLDGLAQGLDVPCSRLVVEAEAMHVLADRAHAAGLDQEAIKALAGKC